MRNHEEAARELEAILKDNPLRMPPSHSTTYQGLLSDLWSGTPIERKLILRALYSGVLDELLTENPQTLSTAAVESFAKKLAEREGISFENSKWSILVWAHALRLGPAVGNSSVNGKHEAQANTPNKQKKSSLVWLVIFFAGCSALAYQFFFSSPRPPRPPAPDTTLVGPDTTVAPNTIPLSSLILRTNESCAVDVLQDGAPMASQVALTPESGDYLMSLAEGAYDLVAVSASKQRLQGRVELRHDSTSSYAFAFTIAPIQQQANVKTEYGTVILGTNQPALVIGEGAPFEIQPGAVKRLKLPLGRQILKAILLEDRSVSISVPVNVIKSRAESANILFPLRQHRDTTPPPPAEAFVAIKANKPARISGDGVAFIIDANEVRLIKLSPGSHKLRATSIADNSIFVETQVVAKPTPSETTTFALPENTVPPPPPPPNRDWVQIGNLQWARLDNPGTDITGIEASAYAAKSRLGGHSDWRLPTAEELSTAIRSGKLRASGITIRGSGIIWSSTRGDGLVQCVDFATGATTKYPSFRSIGRAICVREGKP